MTTSNNPQGGETEPSAPAKDEKHEALMSELRKIQFWLVLILVAVIAALMKG